MQSKTKAKATKPKGEDKQKKQSERFIETARTLGSDESGRNFEHFADKVVPKKANNSYLPNTSQAK